MHYAIDRFLGLNQSSDEHRVSPRYAPEAVNVDVSDGNLAVCKGYAAAAEVGLEGGIGSLGAHYMRGVSGGLNVTLVAANASGIYEWIGYGWRAILDMAGSPQASFLNYNFRGEDVLIAADPVRGAWVWKGPMTAMAPLEGAPEGLSRLALHYERIWGSGIEAEPDSVYWSRAFDPSDWSGDPENPDGAGGVASLPTYNGGRVVALMSMFGDVLAFKDEDLYRVVGTYPGNYVITRVPGVVGPIAPMTAVDAGSACYFLGRDGLCSYNGLSASPVTDARAKRFFERINPAAADRACAAVHRGTLYLSAPLGSSPVNDAVLEIDLRGGGVMERRGIGANSLLSVGGSLFFGGEDGKAYLYGGGDDYAGSPIEARWRTPWIDMGRPGAEKYVQSVSMHASGSFRLEFEWGGGAIARSVDIGGEERTIRLRIGRHGKRFRLAIGNIAGSRFLIRGGLDIDVEGGD